MSKNTLNDTKNNCMTEHNTKNAVYYLYHKFWCNISQISIKISIV